MDPKWVRIAPLLFMLLLAIVLALGLFNHHSARQEKRMVGQIVPSINLPAIAGAPYFTPQLWQGRVAILNVFATWCVPCISENPELIKLARAGVPIYGIAWKDKPQHVKSYLQVRGNPYQAVALDEQGQTTVPLGLTGVPQTYIIDKTGHVVYEYNMPLSDEEVNLMLLPLIKKLETGNAQ